MKTPVVMSWSGGKDSAVALNELRMSGRYEVVALLTSVSDEYRRISHHGVREVLLDRQAEAIGIPLEKVYLPSGIVVTAAMARLVPHPPNVTPIAAMALFGGAFLPSRRLAHVLPLAAMLLSDVVLGMALYGKAMLVSQPVIYACLLATVAMGKLIRDRRSALNIGAVTLASSFMFYGVTNLAVWASGSLYPQSLAGLGTCYAAALPFFRNSLAGDMAFAAALFGGFALLETIVVSVQEKQQTAVA
jgi:hypothetical protein